ncbi:MAG: glycoside hydrolase, partial [Tepidisphaeraceae bacterium]
TRVVCPAGAKAATPRIIGTGPATVWIADFSWKLAGNLDDLRDKNFPPQIRFGNGNLEATFNTRLATLSVTGRQSGRVWSQGGGEIGCFVKSAKQTATGLHVDLLDLPTNLDFSADFTPAADKPELLVTLSAKGRLPRALAFPRPFLTERGTYLVIPMNEGISYPVEDESIPPMNLIAYGGHGICMPFFGATDGSAGYSAILETPNDVHISIAREKGLLHVAPVWESEKGDFGYGRRIRYGFFDTGGHVAIAKTYRQYAQSTGLFKSFDAKRRENPNIDLLVGAANIWCWEKDAVTIAKEMQQGGIKRILWSAAGKPEQLAQMNDLGILTSRYDIYQDVMDPANFPLLRGVHADWTTAGWPKDLMLRADGDWVRGWQVKAKDGSMIPCGTLCDRQALAYARERIPAELKTHAYRARFIDTTTASPYRECYSPDHPMTRTESRKYKVDLLAVVSRENHLVCGSETGHDAAVPVCDFFEGMMSLGPYRVPDAGRDMARIWTEVPPNVARFQLGHRYRLPLWELVYHECVVSYWYWGDYNNKLPALWDKRDQFNALYAVPPMFMFNRALWDDQKARFARSYRASADITRACGYSEMTDHRFLTPDRDVQQTTFGNGMKVTVNFGDKPFSLPGGRTIAAGQTRVDGPGQ